MTMPTTHLWMSAVAAFLLMAGAASTSGNAQATQDVLVAANPATLLASDTHEHSGKAPAVAPAKHDAEAETGIPTSVPDIWKAVQAGRVLLDKVVTEGRLDKVHSVAFWIRDLVAALPGHSKLSEESTVRLKDSVTRTAQIASALDEAGDSGDKTGVAAQLARLDGVLKVVKGLYPAAMTPALEYVCPMHPEVRQSKFGDCSKCGMHLVPDAATMPAPKETHAPASGHEGHGH